MKISNLVKGLLLYKEEHGDLDVECLSNVLGDEHPQHDSIRSVKMCEVEKEKFLVVSHEE